MTKNIVIFGGSFDPFTSAHKNIVEKASLVADEILIIPTIVDWYRKDKDKWLTSKQKIETICNVMSHAKMRNGCNWSWSDDELRLADLFEKKNFTQAEREKFVESRGFYDTLVDAMKNYDQDAQFYFIIGTDQYKKFKEWRNWERILDHAKMIVVQGRNGETVENDIPHYTLTIDPEFANVSATQMRKEWREKGYETFQDYLEYEYVLTVGEEDKIASTPIFDVVKGPMVKKPFDAEKCKGTKKWSYNLCPVLIKAPNWATVIVEKDGKFLMTKQYRYGTKRLSSEFPCGMFEKDELPYEAALRELREETGLEISADNIVSLGSISPNPAFMTNHMYFFYVCLDGKVEGRDYRQVDKQLDEHEELTTYWEDCQSVKMRLNEDSNASSLMLAAVSKLEFSRGKLTA